MYTFVANPCNCEANLHRQDAKSTEADAANRQIINLVNAEDPRQMHFKFDGACDASFSEK